MSRVMTRNGVGEATARIDAVPKVTGAFAYASDLWSEGMLWGATVRSTAASARIRSVDTSAAVAAPGVAAVLVAADVPAKNRFGLNFDDQPVLAEDVIRYAGEPIAVVAADTPAHARAAARAGGARVRQRAPPCPPAARRAGHR